MKRIARDVSVHLFRREREGIRFLMLRRSPRRGGFWQGVTGAPLPGERDSDAAIREVREETGYDVRDSLVSLAVRYHYALRPELADRWNALYGAGVTTITVIAFGAEAPQEVDPVLDPCEHDAFAWCPYEDAWALLAWPVEQDALPGRRQALQALTDTIA